MQSVFRHHERRLHQDEDSEAHIMIREVERGPSALISRHPLVQLIQYFWMYRFKAHSNLKRTA
jgi:hypothetical protein